MLAEQHLGNGYQRGPTTIDLTGTGYSADIYYKGSYITERLSLAQKTEVLIAKAHLWTPEVAKQIVTAGLAKSNPQNTSWIGFRKSDALKGEYIGAAWQEEIFVPTFEGGRHLLYMKLRVFEPDDQGHYLGRTAIQLAVSVYPGADCLAHRSGNPRAVRSWLESGVFREGRRFPYDLTFDKEPELQQILFWIYRQFHIRGRTPNLLTGVSIGDYIEPNGAYVPDPRHESTMKIHRWMTEKLRMKFERGDALYEIGELA